MPEHMIALALIFWGAVLSAVYLNTARIRNSTHQLIVDAARNELGYYDDRALEYAICTHPDLPELTTSQRREYKVYLWGEALRWEKKAMLTMAGFIGLVFLFYIAATIVNLYQVLTIEPWARTGLYIVLIVALVVMAGLCAVFLSKARHRRAVMDTLDVSICEALRTGQGKPSW